MTRAVTAGELTKIRGAGHWSKLYLATLNPETIYTAELDTVPTSYDMVAEITYTSGSGTLANVKAGMSLYVGSTAGGWDLGIVRIRKTPTADTFYIGEQSKVNWGDASPVYLTVVEDFDLWAKHIHMNGTTPYMDYDVVYSDQHSNFNPVPVLGVHRVAKLTGSTVDVTLGCDTANGEASWVYDSTISSYSWSVPDATALSSASAVNPVATFNSVGWHACYCTVTAANGKSKTGMRWVYVWDDDNLPAEVFKITGWEEDFESGGVVCSVEMNDDVDLTEIRERSLCIMFSVDYYAGTEGSIGQVTNAENIRMVGRVGDEGIEYSPEMGRVGLEIQSYQYWFSKIPGFPVGVEISNNTPDAWTNLPKLTVDRGLWHLLEWRSTALGIMDFFPSGDARYSPEVSAYTGNLWGQMQEFITQQILGYVGVDPLGRLHAGVDPQIIPEADRSSEVVTVMTLQDDDLLPDSQMDKQIVSDTSLVDVSGINVDQYGGSVLTYFAVSPGSVFGEFGSVEIADRLLLQSQDDCNELAGLLYGWRSNKYKEFSITLIGNNPMIGCFPGQYVVYTIPAANSPRGEEVARNFIPRRRSVSFDNDRGTWEIQLDLEAESFEENAIEYVPPAGDSINIPPLPPLPDLPDFPPLFPGDTGSDAPEVVIAVDNNLGILYTKNFNADTPDWQFWNTGLATGDKANIVSWVGGGSHGNESILFVTPSGACYTAILDNGSQLWYVKLYYAAGIGAPWELIVDQTQLTTWVGGTPAKLFGAGFNATQPNEVALIVGNDFTGRFFLGNNSGFTQTGTFSRGAAYIKGGLTYGDNHWVHDLTWANNESWVTFNADGSAVVNASSGFGQSYGYWTVRAGTSSLIFKSHPLVTGLDGILRSTDNGITWDVISTSPVNLEGLLAASWDGNTLFGCWDAASAKRGRSYDSGYSWDGSFLTPLDRLCYAYAGGSGTKSRFITARGVMYYTDDMGLTWDDKRGNLPYLIPVGQNINKLVVPGFTVDS